MSVSLDRPCLQLQYTHNCCEHLDLVHVHMPESSPAAQLRGGGLEHRAQGEPCKACHVGRPSTLKMMHLRGN
ncbi:hypothetical protein V8C35DRAFT_316681 [Trichoderma chlorosporum]